MVKSVICHLAVAAALAFGLPASSARAQSEGPILTVSGKVNDAAGAVIFDRKSLEQIGLSTVETTTPWHAGKVRFEGVLMRDLMRKVGAKGTHLEASALNDYSTQIPMEDFDTYNVILATRKDGEPMPVRDKGPLFIIYPYDSSPDLRSAKFYGRSAWQVKELRVK
jgi:hypothetical protein